MYVECNHPTKANSRLISPLASICNENCMFCLQFNCCFCGFLSTLMKLGFFQKIISSNLDHFSVVKSTEEIKANIFSFRTWGFHCSKHIKVCFFFLSTSKLSYYCFDITLCQSFVIYKFNLNASKCSFVYQLWNLTSIIQQFYFINLSLRFSSSNRVEWWAAWSWFLLADRPLMVTTSKLDCWFRTIFAEA